jgi:hypothetical protein
MDNSEEHIKPILGFPFYYASNTGFILSEKRGKRKILKGGTDKDGYRKVILCVDNKRFHKRVHIIVANVFNGMQPENTVVCHIDGSRTNNASINLKYATQKENILDKITHETMCFGESHQSSKLKEKQVIDIFLSDMSPLDLAKKYNMSKGAIYGIKKHRTWVKTTKDIKKQYG